MSIYVILFADFLKKFPPKDYEKRYFIFHSKDAWKTEVSDLPEVKNPKDLLSKLKEEGLVLGLNAGGGSSHPDINSFGISVSLTPKGLKEYERILVIVFNYIQMIRDHGIEEYTFKENQTMAQINFDWKNPSEGMGFVSSKASLLQEYELEDVETLPFLLTKYDPEAYKAVLDTLIPENAMFVLSHQNAETNKVAPYYDAKYSFEKIFI